MVRFSKLDEGLQCVLAFPAGAFCFHTGSSYNTLVQTLVDSSSPRAKRPRNESEPDSNSSIQDIVKKEVTAIVDKVVERLAENQGGKM